MLSIEAILYIIVLLAGAKAMTYVFQRIHQPVLVGNVIAGIVLGPALFAVVRPVEETEIILSIGIFFLFFLMGIEIDLKRISKMLQPKLIIAAIVAFAIPFAIGIQFVQLLDIELTKAVIIGSVIGVTSMGVVAKVLIDLGKIRTTLGLQIFTIGIIVELLGVIITGITSQIEISSTEVTTIPIIILKIVAFFAIACAIAYYVMPKFLSKLKKHVKSKYVHFAFIVSMILIFGYFAEISGLHGAIGALIFGVAFTRINKEYFEKSISYTNRLGQGYLIPLFFAGIGIYFNFDFLELALVSVVGFLLFIPGIKFISGLISTKHIT